MKFAYLSDWHLRSSVLQQHFLCWASVEEIWQNKAESEVS
jgi:hypothetical protein